MSSHGLQYSQSRSILPINVYRLCNHWIRDCSAGEHHIRETPQRTIIDLNPSVHKQMASSPVSQRTHRPRWGSSMPPMVAQFSLAAIYHIIDLHNCLTGLGAFFAPFVATKFSQIPHWSLYFLTSLGIALTNLVALLLLFRFRRRDG